MVPATLHHSNIPEEYVPAYTAINGNVEDTPVINRKTMETFYRELPHPSQYLLNTDISQMLLTATLLILFNSLL